MDYSKLSDAEIDQLVTVNEFNLKGWEFSESGNLFFHCGADGSGYFEQPVLSFCSDWSIAGPLIEKLKIDITYHSSGGCDAAKWCDSVGDWLSSQGENPLRAAMIVYLMMQDELKG